MSEKHPILGPESARVFVSNHFLRHETYAIMSKLPHGIKVLRIRMWLAAALLIVCGSIQHSVATESASSDRLFDIIFSDLTNRCPQISPADLTKAAGRVALGCKGATNSLTLYDRLVELLPGTKLGLDAAQQVKAALHIADGVFPLDVSNLGGVAQKPAPESKAEPNHPALTSAPAPVEQPAEKAVPHPSSRKIELKDDATASLSVLTNLPVSILTNLPLNFYTNLPTDLLKLIPSHFLTNLPTQIATNLAPLMVTSRLKDLTITSSNRFSGLTVQVGSISLDPFSIKTTDADGHKQYTLDQGGVSTRFMVQLNYTDRWAWKNPPGSTAELVKRKPNSRVITSWNGDIGAGRLKSGTPNPLRSIGPALADWELFVPAAQ